MINSMACPTCRELNQVVKVNPFMNNKTFSLSGYSTIHCIVSGSNNNLSVSTYTISAINNAIQYVTLVMNSGSINVFGYYVGSLIISGYTKVNTSIRTSSLSGSNVQVRETYLIDHVNKQYMLIDSNAG